MKPKEVFLLYISIITCIYLSFPTVILYSFDFVQFIAKCIICHFHHREFSWLSGQKSTEFSHHIVVELNKPGSVREVLYEFQPSFYIYILHLFI